MLRSKSIDVNVVLTFNADAIMRIPSSPIVELSIEKKEFLFFFFINFKIDKEKRLKSSTFQI